MTINGARKQTVIASHGRQNRTNFGYGHFNSGASPLSNNRYRTATQNNRRDNSGTRSNSNNGFQVLRSAFSAGLKETYHTGHLSTHNYG